MNEDNVYNLLPRLEALRQPMPYHLARRVADLSLRTRIVRVGPRVIAALVGEVDDSHAQVGRLVDALAECGDGLMACRRQREAARAEAAQLAHLADELGAENERLRHRLAALHPSGAADNVTGPGS